MNTVKTINQPIALISTYIWIGFVCAISFMEAWLKFRAPGITLPLGLGIGRIVFDALNKMEWIFSIIIILNLFFSNEKKITWNNVYFSIAFFILLIQTFWLLPALDARAELHIQNKIVLPSNIHFYYIILEMIKVISLSIFGILFIKKTKI